MRRMGMLVAMSLVGLALAQGGGRDWARAEGWCRITDSKINESSGIAPSREFPGEYFTHNDSGDSARFFRFNQAGNVTGEFSLVGVKARDWEDMATASLGGKNYVYLADIGDNDLKYDSIKIYRCEEPKGSGREISNFETYTVTYPGGPRNAEAFMVDPRTGDLWVVQKVNGKGGIYRLRRPSKSGKYKFEQIGSIDFPDGPGPMRVITGGSVSPDGKFLALRTYAYAYEFPIPGKEMNSWLRTSSKRVQPAFEIQGEAICYSLDGRSLMTTSEGSPCVVSKIGLK